MTYFLSDDQYSPASAFALSINIFTSSIFVSCWQCIALSQQLCKWYVGLKVKIIIPSHTFLLLCMKQGMIWVTLTKLLFRTTIGHDYHSTITFNINISGNTGFSVFFSVVHKDQLGVRCYQIRAAVASVHSCLMNVFPLILRLHLRQFCICLLSSLPALWFAACFSIAIHCKSNALK